ncbi:MAG: hypothetical protein E6Q93_14015 [Burkholderiaceae bacterium]|nr:MAG: hypothetical protein E6Q93_14015 [Burkholderiaceae bacterium]
MVRRNGGRGVYPASTQRPLTGTPPAPPAAVLLFDDRSQLHTLALDFDVARGDRRVVERDTGEALQMLSEAGLLPWADAAPTGGRHVYARLPHPVPAVAVARLTAALAARWASLDVSPLLNTSGGCIRPPGAAHKTAGFQRLVSPLEYVRRATAHTPDPEAWDALWAVTGAAKVSALPAHFDAPITPDAAAGVARRALGAQWEAIAHGGKHSYPSDSEARMAVIGGCVRAGWSLADLEAAITGPWARGPLARHLHAKYRSNWRDRVGKEFTKARSNHLNSRVHRSVRNSDTRPGSTRGGSPTTLLSVENPHLALRKFCSFTTDYARQKRFTPVQRSVLRAVIWAGLVQGRLVVNAGCRALAEQAGCHLDTVAATLHEIAGHGLLQRIREGRGPAADLWQINAELGRDHRPVKGRVLGLHPVFRVLGGHRTAEVWHELQRSRAPLSADAIGTKLGYARQRIAEDLRLLAGWNLAQRAETGGGWILGAADADQLAAALGGDEHRRAQHERHVAQRAAWHRCLLQRGEHTPLAGQLDWDVLLAVAAPGEHDWIREHASGVSPPSADTTTNTVA